MKTMPFKKFYLKNIQLYIIISLFLFSFESVTSDKCFNATNLKNKTCYNDVITFNHDNWRAGHACNSKNGDLIVEFSLNPGESSKRLFYGLNKKGRYYFPNEPVYKEIGSMVCQDCDNNNYRGRFESRNILVSLDGDSTNKEYLFSVSTYYSLAELIKFDSDDFTYYAWNMTKFFGLTRPIFSYEYSLFEIGNSKTYVLAFIESAGFQYNSESKKDEEYSNKVTLKKFKLKKFDTYGYKEIIETVTLNNTYNGRVVSAFRLDSSSTIVLIFVTSVDATAKKGDYKAYFYNDDLNKKGECSIYDGVTNIWIGFGIFVKGISIKDNYAAVAFFSNGDSKSSLSFKVMEYNGETFNYPKIIYDFTSYSFRPDVQSNGLYKLSDNRVVLFTTDDYDGIDYGCLHMFLIDLYNTYNEYKMRHYKFDYPGKRFAKEMDASIYNGYIVFTATLSNNAQNETFAIMMLFGFANGTDHTIDISPYLMDTGSYDSSNNLYDYLMTTMSIDNNIFGYERIEQIRLIKICDELKLYKGESEASQNKPLPLNELFDANHILHQNKDIIKEEDKLYSLEYQFMVKEPTYNKFYEMPIQVISDTPDFSASDYYSPKTLNGRVNILKFKLCHRYCKECKEYGSKVNDNNQKCETCKDEYTYDYLMYVNSFTGNCVPKDYMYDKEENTLKKCDGSNYKFYYNKTRNDERYCFKYDYNCPDVYHYLNEETHECLDYTPPVDDPVIDKPSTIIIEKPSTIINEHPTNTLDNKCSGSILSETCKNLTNQELYQGILEEVLSRFPPNGESVIIPGKKGYKFQVTTPPNELEALESQSDLPIIDLGNCDQALRTSNQITGDLPLIIYKFYKDADLAKDKEIQFEVYDPYTYKKLNLSACKNINIYVPVNLSEDASIYKNIIDQGYDPFDINDKFYREICTQYDSENGTDVLLDAREEYYYSPIVNETSCQGNCHYSAYSLDTKYLICECDVNPDGIVTLDVKHFDEKNVAYSFYSSLKLSNYKVVICYNLVFNFKIFCKNYGSIISAALIGLYIGSIILFSIKSIQPLKVEISKFLFETKETKSALSIETKKVNNIQRRLSKRTTGRSISKKSNNNPPKKDTTNSANKKQILEKNIINSESTDLKAKKSKNIRNKNNTSNNDIIINSKYSSKILLKKHEKEKSNIFLIGKEKNSSKKEKTEDKNKKQDEEDEILDPDLMDNYELNNLEYEQACEYDKRSFCRTYISTLFREELVLFTFFSCHDYNLLYVKLARFLILACTNMTMTALFFFHKTMYKKQDIEENWSFVQKLPQLLFVLIANHIIEVYLCFLSMTDSSVYEIKALSKKPNNGKKIIDIIDCMKAKLIAFFISTFILFLAFWYFISAFCAVYKNTQMIFIRDSSISFVTSLLDPFIIYGITMILRRISLSLCCKKKACCLYKLSDIIPFF